MIRKRIFKGMALLVFTGVLAGMMVRASESGVVQKAQALIETQAYKSAIEILDEVKANGEDTIEVNLLLAEALSGRINQVGMLKKISLAKKIKKSLEHTLELAPQNLDALEGLVQFHLQAPASVGGDKDEARLLVEKIIKIDGLRGHLSGAELEQAMKNIPAAQAHLDKAYALAPKNIDVILGQSSLAAEAGAYQKAVDILGKCLELEAENVQCHYLVGKFADIGKVETDKGISSLQSVIKTGVEDKTWLAYTHFRLGNLLVRKGNVKQARAQYQAAVNIDKIKPAQQALKNLRD